jgi:sugar lactone lactonase YvrE
MNHGPFRRVAQDAKASEISPWQTVVIKTLIQERSMPDVRQAQPLAVPDSDALRFLPEGPIPLQDGYCSWVGIQHGADSTSGSLNLLNLSTLENHCHHLPGRPGFAFPCQTPDKFVVGCERTLGFFNVKTQAWDPFCDGVDADVTNTIINDGICYEDNLIFGTKDLEFATKKAGLYLFRGSDQKLIRLRDDQVCSNGKAILHSDDGGLRLIDIDTPTRQVVSYSLDVASASLGPAEVLIDFAGDPALPDGAILTPDGSGLIVAMFRPEVAACGETRWYDLASGELQCTWQTPGSPQNTCPALVRVEGVLKLLITTAVENLTSEDQQRCPNAGQLFIADIDVDDRGGPLTDSYQA